MNNVQINSLKVGDIILTPAGNYRTVLAVHRCKGRVNVLVAILHCSWTHRPFTILDRAILRLYSKSSDRDPNVLRKKYPRKIIADAAALRERICECCDVIGRFQ